MIYIDSEYRCHTTNPDGVWREFDVPFFNDKCKTFIEGYRYIPDGEGWTRDDGAVCTGMTPWKDYDELDAAQREYERELLADAENALAILLGGVSE